MRFFVSQDRQRAAWRHELDSREGSEYADWIDCTDMNDDEFGAFMCVNQRCAKIEPRIG